MCHRPVDLTVPPVEALSQASEYLTTLARLARELDWDTLRPYLPTDNERLRSGEDVAAWLDEIRADMDQINYTVDCDPDEPVAQEGQVGVDLSYTVYDDEGILYAGAYGQQADPRNIPLLVEDAEQWSGKINALLRRCSAAARSGHDVRRSLSSHFVHPEVSPAAWLSGDGEVVTWHFADDDRIEQYRRVG
jgi:hypothetical protein